MNIFKRRKSNEFNNNCYNIINKPIYLKPIEPDEISYLISKCNEHFSFYEGSLTNLLLKIPANNIFAVNYYIQ